MLMELGHLICYLIIIIIISLFTAADYASGWEGVKVKIDPACNMVDTLYTALTLHEFMGRSRKKPQK